MLTVTPRVAPTTISTTDTDYADIRPTGPSPDPKITGPAKTAMITVLIFESLM